MSPRPAVNPEHEQPKHLSRPALKRLLVWLRPHRRAIALNVSLTLVLTAVELAVPQLLQTAIDGVVGATKALAVAAETEKAAIVGGAWDRILVVTGVFVGLFGLSQVVRFFEIRRTSTFAQWFMYQMRGKYFAHLHRLSPAFYDKWKAGQLIARGTSDMDALQDAVSWAPNHITAAVFQLVGVVAVMLWKDWVLFLAVFPILPVLVLLTRRFRVRATEAWRQVRAQTGRLTANVAESIAGARVIQAFAREAKNMAIFSNLTSDLYTTRVETQRVHNRYMIGIGSLRLYATVVVILMGSYRVSRGTATPGEVAAFLAYAAMFFRPIDMLSHLYNQLLHSLAALDRVIEVLDTEPQIVDRPSAVNPADFQGAVTFDHVTFEYKEGDRILHDVSFRARPGEVIALVGPTGAGKTTMCRLISRFYETQQGSVRIDDWDVKNIALDALHRRTGIVLQENFLFSGTVMDNIRYGRPSATDGEVIECARQIGSHRAVEALPKGYQTEVGERGESLSAGQRQLICFTRAMLADPRILILDEATSSVDTQAELEIQDALRQLTERRTCFIVAHRLSTVHRADRVLVVEDGRITEEGPHAELLAAGGRYAAMYKEFIRAE
ncbi:MAG TPA: ABC transporter ATP-binding protein [Phycisphaerae bacterium]|nr:ABC transporter ATP-binding protein [Phycisphaerae bacterium]